MERNTTRNGDREVGMGNVCGKGAGGGGEERTARLSTPMRTPGRSDIARRERTEWGGAYEYLQCRTYGSGMAMEMKRPAKDRRLSMFPR